ncbi:MAG: DNA recombination protein RmuC [Elusimicrobia bacterium]|nr:DNA recombination protein RmuC [Elusimicrobiota bacterium]
MLYLLAAANAVLLGLVLWLVLSERRTKDDLDRMQTQVLPGLQDALARLDERANTASRRMEDLPQVIGSTKDETLRQLRAELQATKSDFQNKTDSAVSSIQSSTSQFMEGLKQVTGQIDRRLEGAAATLEGLRQSTGQLMSGLQTVSDLRDVFLVPQRRGPQSEVHLQSLLENIFPKEVLCFGYHPDPGASEHVEAAVKIADRWLAIDSKAHVDKFLEYKRTNGRKEKTAFLNAVKSSIEDISSKYILPDRGTHDFAFLFVPAESLWLDMVDFKVDEGGAPDLFNYARSRKVIMVSPQTLYPYLRLVIVAMAGKQLQQKAQDLHMTLQSLLTRFQEARESVEKASKQLGNAKSNLDEARQRLGDFEQSLSRGVSLSTPENAELPSPT